jgi:hypothetical protein
METNLERPGFALTTLQLHYRELAEQASAQALAQRLPQFLGFFARHPAEAAPYVKHLVKRLCSETLSTMTQKEKSGVSWRGVATRELASEFAIATGASSTRSWTCSWRSCGTSP